MTEEVAETIDRKKWWLFGIVATVSLVFDQITKIWARDTLPTFPEGCAIPYDLIPSGDRGVKCAGTVVEVFESFWHWRLSMNTGSAFGLFSSQDSARVFLSVVGILAVLGMFWMLHKARPDQRVLHWALALVAGGAVGNLIDRIYYGAVTDFVLWHLGDPVGSRVHPGLTRWEHEWPVFNIADVALVVGVGLMFIDIHKETKREKALRAARDERARKHAVKELT